MAPSFQAFCSRVIKELCSHQPVVATLAGVHDFDGQLDELSPSGLAAHERSLRANLGQLARFDGALTPAQELDRRLLESRLSGLLFTVTTLRPWSWNPDYWTETCGEGVNSLIAHRSAEPGQALEACVRRLREVPQVFALAQRQLEDPPRALVEVAEEQARGSIRYYEKVVPRAFPEVSSRKHRRRLEAACLKAAQAARGYAAHLRGRQGRAGAPIGIGEEALHTKLALDDLVPQRPSELALLARAELKRIRARCEELAGLVVEEGGAKAALRALAADRPGPQFLLPEVRALVRELASFCRLTGLVTLPPTVRCEVEAMPSFLTEMTLAAMDVPGPFDAPSSAAQYLITLPEASWSRAEKEACLRFFNRTQAAWITAHEAFPGHLVQLSALRYCPSPVRRFFGPDTFVEGWAHYAEALVFEAGFRAGDAGALLAKEHGALLRAARCVAALEIHAGQMSLPQATRFLRDEGLFSPALAKGEALRCAVDLSCPAYTLGRLGLERLRARALAEWGRGFTPRRFHDAVLSEGQLPLPLLEEALFSPATASASAARTGRSSSPESRWR